MILNNYLIIGQRYSEYLSQDELSQNDNYYIKKTMYATKNLQELEAALKEELDLGVAVMQYNEETIIELPFDDNISRLKQT